MDNFNQLVEVLFRLLNIPLSVVGYSSFVTLISILTSIWTSSKMVEDTLYFYNNNLYSNKANREFDFIVGGGSAGAVVANRLSEHFEVLLLEAGGDPSPYNSIPGFAPFNLHLPTDWRYRIVPQKDACLAVDERRLPWPRGKTLGGSSQLNFMIYMRGHPRDYNHWAELSEDEDWTYENLLPFFKRSEDYHGNFPDPKFHGTGGPLHVSKQSYQPSLKHWLAAGEELGFNTTGDPNAYQPTGFYPLDVTIWQGKREGTYEAFLKPFQHRKNLRIHKFSHVTRINIDDDLRATGVRYVRDGKVFTAFARNEVVISAGAIGTPHLLMLSGIGPEEHLRAHNIVPKVNLPGVGQNLQDHVLTMIGPFLMNTSDSFIADRNLTLSTILEYGLNKTGPISFNIVSGLAMIASSKGDPSWPDLELHMTPVGVRHGASEDFTVLYGLKPNYLMEYLAPYTGSDANFVLLDLGRPKTTGDIQLRSRDPFTLPRIDPKYFDHPDDIEAMVDGMEFIVKLYEDTNAFQSVGAKFVEKKLPGCDHLPDRSREYFECFIRHLTVTIYHPCCTAKFGRDSDPMAVLDSKLRVRGVLGLRVADASVMPKITNANLNAPCIMIGEKAAQLILDEWTAPPK